jgi:PTH1 family peptidyl-tRNA hydrolase
LAQVVVGLGNPGPEYRDTRHNIGQRVVDELARRLKKFWHPDRRALVARGTWRGDTLYLVKPQSFMNVSGPVVRHALQAFGTGPEDLVLVYDDIDMVLGKVRIRLKGSAGGHNGVQSVIDALGTEAIRRVKIGIGRPEHKAQVPDHVLTTFEQEEEPIVAAAVTTAAERVLGLLGKP